jgi:hypothetical protein
VAECLPSNLKALRSKPRTTTKRKEGKKEARKEGGKKKIFLHVSSV